VCRLVCGVRVEECLDTENCDLKVTVNSCADIVVVPDGMSTDHAVNLRWTIVTPGYKFVADSGIEFSDSQFVVKNAPKPDQFHVHNNKTKPGTFPYKVNIEGCAPVDPYIQNK